MRWRCLPVCVTSQGIRGWKQIVQIYGDLTNLAQRKAEELPNYVVSGEKGVCPVR
jgi:hypothetical protein